MLMPIGQMILVRAAGPRNMARVMSAIGIPIILAPVFGPTLGGLLVEHVGWQWIFFVNLPIGVARRVRRAASAPRGRRGHRRGRSRSTLLGLALVATGLVGITYGLAESGVRRQPDRRPRSSSRCSLGLALVAAFVAPRPAHPSTRCSTSACTPTRPSRRRR